MIGTLWGGARMKTASDCPFSAESHPSNKTIELNRKQEESHETSPQPDLPHPSFLFLLWEGSGTEDKARSTTWRSPN
jgi:hypothetical protein